MQRAHPSNPPVGAATDRPGAGQGWPLGLVFVALLLVTLAAYWPALRGELLWDDAGHVTRPDLQSASGLGRIWFEPGATQQYYPLLHSAFWLEHQLWGDATLGYHLVNVLWHATAACLFAGLLRRLSVRGATLAAFVFALHPVAVESVAWISEQKNTLSLVAYLAAALAWLRFEDDRRPARYAVATAWFVAALLTKTVTATLPAALLVLGWWRRGSVSWRRDVVPLLPWFGLGIAAGLGTAWIETTQIGASGGDFALGPVERVLLAGRVVWFYLGKLVWPAGLAFFYPRWTIDASTGWLWLSLAATVAVLGLGVGWSRRRERGLLAAALLYGGTLFPVLGFVNVYPFVFSYVADHFQYHASLVMIAFLTAAATRGFAWLAWPRWSGAVVAAGVLALFAGLTWRQSATYRDEFALYEASLAQTPDSWVARLNLGVALLDAGRTAEALPHLRRADELKPDFPETLNSLANALIQSGRAAEAEPLLRRAIALHPRFDAAHNTLGTSLMALGQTAAGVEAFRRAVDLNPHRVAARVNLGWALANSGRTDEALVQLAQARREEPENADAEYKSGLVRVLTRRMAEAEPHFRRAVQLAPGQAEYRQSLGLTLLDLGRPAEAAAQFEAALDIAPGLPGAAQGLELARRRLGR
ncbi:MAG: tetratricopeptide repeat protein [Opitutaceae bacterium]